MGAGFRVDLTGLDPDDVGGSGTAEGSEDDDSSDDAGGSEAAEGPEDDDSSDDAGGSEAAEGPEDDDSSCFVVAGLTLVRELGSGLRPSLGLCPSWASSLRCATLHDCQ